jgi:glycosyltransferase involved in cell wall biosynthesis
VRIVITFPQRLSTPGGGSIGCQRIAAGLARLGADVQVFAVERGDPTFAVEPTLRVHGVPPSRGHYLLDAWRVRARVAGQASVTDWVVGWSTEAAQLAALCRRRPRFAMVLAMPSYRAWFDRTTSWRWLKRWTDWYFRTRPARQAHLVFALSRFSAGDIVETMRVRPERVVVAHWGVDDRFLNVQRAPKPGRVLFYGSLAPIKGVFDAVAACGVLARSGVAFELRIAGWGDWEAVARAVRDAGIGDRVTYLGTLDREGLCRELSRAAVALLPSHAESFGIAIAEAQAAAVPVVSYRAGSVPEVVQDGATGILVEPGSTHDLAEAVCSLLQDPDHAHAMGGAGRRRVAELFTWERTAKTMLEAMRRYRVD